MLLSNIIKLVNIELVIENQFKQSEQQEAIAYIHYTPLSLFVYLAFKYPDPHALSNINLVGVLIFLYLSLPPSWRGTSSYIYHYPLSDEGHPHTFIITP